MILRAKSSLYRKQTIFAWCVIIPCMAITLLFLIYPIIQTFVGSFFDWNALTGSMDFNGVGNYSRILGDEIFFKSLNNTFFLTFFAVFIKTVLALLTAILLFNLKKSQSLYRAIFFLPTICTMISTAFVFRFLFQPDGGAINGYLAMLGIDGPGWLLDPEWAMPTVVLYTIWKDFGYVFLIFLAGIQGVSDEVLEAASIDGATGWKKVRYIILPLLRPITAYNVITQVIGSLQIFTSIIALTNNSVTSTSGGPMYMTTTTGLYIYQSAFTDYQFGYASTIATLLFLIIMVFTVVQIKFMNPKGEQ